MTDAIRYGHDCAGINAAGPAWDALGWQCQWFTEIEKFPCEVLKYHYPKVPNLGDTTKAKHEEHGAIDLLIGGTPCQDFSVSRIHKAGNRSGLDGDRSGLARNFIGIIDKLEPEPPRWIIWENVPGAMSTNGGRDLGAFVRELEKRDYGVCGRVLDAQYFGCATRRKRLFIVASLGDWRPAVAVLFDSECIPALHDKAQTTGDHLPNLKGEGGGLSLERLSHLVFVGGVMRRLTPLERERCMGFPDRYTAIQNASDRQRNDALGNSIAVPVLRWIGNRIQMVEDIMSQLRR